MDFQTAVRTCLRKYAVFEGRASRPEFWWFILFVVLGKLVFGVLDGIVFASMMGPVTMGPGVHGWEMGGMLGIGGGPLAALFGLAMLLPSIAAGARRLHDVGRSGWWLLLWFIPLFGWLVLLYWFVQPGRDRMIAP